MSRFHILDPEGNPQPAADADQWAMFFGDAKKRFIADSPVIQGNPSAGAVVTLFIGIGDVLFESFVVDGPIAGRTRRYPTRAEALGGHEQLLQEALDAYRRPPGGDRAEEA